MATGLGRTPSNTSAVMTVAATVWGSGEGGAGGIGDEGRKKPWKVRGGREGDLQREKRVRGSDGVRR